MRVNAGMAAREDIVSLSDRIHNPGAPFIAAGMAAILGLAIGVVASPSEPVTVEVPGPTQTIEVPGPTQTIEVPGPTIEVAPTACMDAIDDLMDVGLPFIDFALYVYDDYLDFPDENLEQFGARVEQRLTDLDLIATGLPEVPELAIGQCRAAS